MFLAEARWVERTSCGENAVTLVSGVLVDELWLPKEEDIGDTPRPIARGMIETYSDLQQSGCWLKFLGRLLEIRVRCYLFGKFC